MTTDTNGMTDRALPTDSAFEAKLAKLRAVREPKIEAAAAERAARDTDELDAVFAALDEIGGTWEENVLQVKDAPPDRAGHVVVRRPNKGELARHRSIVIRANVANPERGSVEARAKASSDLALNCVVYPPAEKYQALLEFAGAVSDNVFVITMRLAEGGSREDAKK